MVELIKTVQANPQASVLVSFGIFAGIVLICGFILELVDKAKSK